MSNQHRVLKGVPSGGQFAATQHNEPGISVGDDTAGLPDVGAASVDEIRAIAETSTDPEVLAELTASPRIPDDVLERLAEPEQAPAVRLAAVNTGYPGTADRAAHDPNPFVRAAAAVGWDLSEANRRRLANDRSVHRVMGLLAS